MKEDYKEENEKEGDNGQENDKHDLIKCNSGPRKIVMKSCGK